MQEASFKSLPSVRSPRITPRFTADEKRRIFRGMVVGELEAGFLRYSRRQALIAYASHLGISEFDANLLIAEAQYHAGDIEPLSFENVAAARAVSHPESWSAPLRLASALIVAIALDLLLIGYLFH